MRIPKRYGQSKVNNCPFCGKVAIVNNDQGIPVCQDHRDKTIPAIRCYCGKYLELCKGKYGPYFRCTDCGNISFAKGMGLLKGEEDGSRPFKVNGAKRSGSQVFGKEKSRQVKYRTLYKAKQEDKKETVLTSDELDFYF